MKISKVIFGITLTLTVVSIFAFVCKVDSSLDLIECVPWLIASIVFGVSTFVLNNPNVILRMLVPTWICICAFIHNIIPLNNRLTIQSYRLYRKYGSFFNLFKKCADSWDNITDGRLYRRFI